MASRDELEAEAVKLGLASVSTYQNKKVVEKAIERVRGGEQAAVVDNEYQQEVDATEGAENASQGDQAVNSGLDPEIIEDETEVDETTDDDADDDDTTDDETETEDDAPAAPAKREKKLVKNRNNGHPTKFDATGRPLFKA